MRHLPHILYGYSDPPDYRPAEGPRLENLDPFTDGHFSLALQAMVRMLAPELAETARLVLADGPAPLEEGHPRPRTGLEIEATAANSITVRDDPAPACEEVTLLHAAWRGESD